MGKVMRYSVKGLKSKYSIALILFLLWILFFDDHSLIHHFKNNNKLSELTLQEVHLRKKIQSDRLKMYQLKTSQENLEKFAREQFLMKKPNEDVFLIEEE